VSVVYQALDTVLGRRAAIKMLDPTLAGDTQAQARIRREATITDRVRHPGVPRIYEFGDAPLADGTVVPYVVMELITGTVLASHLGNGALPWTDAVRVAGTVADILTATHKRGVVHRDLTAANIMMTADGPKIIDFGLAVTVPTPDQDGGPYVLAPSLLPANDFAGRGEPADDVYALGVLLYQMVTGRSPYPAGDLASVATSGGMRWVAPTPVLTVPGLPRAVAEICRRCMAKRPAERPDAAAVALDLWATLMPTPEALYHRSTALPALPAAPPVTEQPVRSARPGHSGSARRTVDLARRRRPAWSGPTTGQNAVVRSR
jgi:serine/threonine-protein kinase